MIVTDINVLKTKSTSVDDSDDLVAIKKLMVDELLSHDNGFAIAAIQVGIPKRIIAIKGDEDVKFYINPEIIDAYDPYITTEMCLSFPDKVVTVKRFQYCQFKDSQRPTGYVAEGKTAQAIQHEIDHLDGLTMFDREYKAFTNIGRNEPCPCGSGKKYKRCCGR